MNSSLLVEAAIRSVFLALAVWMGLGVLKVRNVLAQKAVWGLVLAGALAMPLVLPMASHWSVLPANVRVVLPADPETLLEELQARIQAKTPPEQEPAAQPAGPSEGALMVEEQPGPSVNGASGNIDTAAPKPESSDADRVEYVQPQLVAESESAAPRAVVQPRATYSLSKIVLLLYVGVAGIFLIRLACGLIAALRLWRRAKPISGTLLTSSDAPVDLRCSTEVLSPVTICSAIVLPVDYATWDSEKLRVVLAHERSHIRQKDFYLQLLAGVYAAVVWFSPLGWWLKHKLSDLAEAISDRAGLEEAADRASYAQILLEFAAAPRPTLIGVAMARSGSLSRRIERLLNEVSFRQAFAGSSRALAAVLVVPVVLFAATALVRVQAAGQQAPPEPPAPAVAPQAGVPAPPAPAAAVAPAAPASGVSQPVQITGEVAPAAPQDPAVPSAPAEAPAPAAAPQAAPGPTPPAPAVAPRATIDGPAVLTIVPPEPPTKSMTLIAPKAPHAPGAAVLLINPPNAARVKLMIQARATLANRELILASPGAPRMAILAAPKAYGVGRGYGVGQSTTESGTSNYSENGKHSGYHYSYSSNGESYAVIHGDSEHMTFSGNWIEGRREEIDKARKQAHGDFLWFARDGKSYFVDDPTTLSQIEAMYKPMEELGKQQEELGRQQEALGKQQEALGEQQEKASVPTPDMSKEIAEIDEAMAKLKANQGKAMNEEQFAELQSKLGDLQGKLGEIQGKIGSKQGEFGEQMGKLGSMQGELGAKQGRLGAEQGRIGQEADRKVRSIIDESMKNGKAHPVQ
jgi:beta-lactamase regulating signal transducer with metallopeptidase domain